MKKNLVKVITQKVEELKDNRQKDYKVTFNIQGEYTVRQGEDYTQVISFAIPYDKLLMLAMNKLNGVTVESLVNEVLENDEVDTKEFKQRVSTALTKIKGKAQRNCKGKVTTANILLTKEEIEVCEYC